MAIMAMMGQAAQHPPRCPAVALWCAERLASMIDRDHAPQLVARCQGCYQEPMSLIDEFIGTIQQQP
jgi:hypothetical protein